MATQSYAPAPSPYRPLRPTSAVNPIAFNNSTDARKATANQRQLVQGQGDALMAQDSDLANQYRDQAGGVEDYLNPIEDQMATGNGGYNPEETKQIQYSPEEQQALISKAGISSGVGTAATVGAANRAAAAAGGSPAALATYRARAAQDMAANAGDAMTGARVAGKQLESQGAQTTGNARLGQQNTALNYYSGLQSQKNQNALGEQGLQQGAFQTTTAGTGAATNDVLKASQTPTLTDKLIGGAAGVVKGLASAGAVADGTTGYMGDGGYDAVLGEDGPEAIIEAASDPVRSDTKFMADGDVGGEALPSLGPGYNPAMAPTPSYSPFKDYMAKMQQGNQAAPEQKEAWNPTTPYRQAGDAIGSVIGHLADGTTGGDDYMANGGVGIPRQVTNYRPRPAMPPKIITSPTRVHLNKGDSVVPLNYRPMAKIRPSALMGGGANA